MSAAHPERPEPTHRRPGGALELWWQELRAGVRSLDTYDTLFRAACDEARGLDAQRDGLPLAASDAFERAERRVIEAASAKAKRTTRAA